MATLVRRELQERLHIVSRHNTGVVAMGADQPLLVDLFLDCENVSLGKGQLVGILCQIMVEGLNLPEWRERDETERRQRERDSAHLSAEGQVVLVGCLLLRWTYWGPVIAPPMFSC